VFLPCPEFERRENSALSRIAGFVAPKNDHLSERSYETILRPVGAQKFDRGLLTDFGAISLKNFGLSLGASNRSPGRLLRNFKH